MGKITGILAGLAWAWAGGLWAGSAANVETSWLGIPVNARQAAMAGAVGAVADGVDALGVNPAGLSELAGNQASFLHNLWAQGLTAEHLAYGRGSGGSGFAVGGDYLDFGPVDQYGIGPSGAPVPNGTFTPMGMDAGAGYGTNVGEDISMGVDAKIITQNLQGTGSTTAAADGGFRLRLPSEGIALGLALLNFGGALDRAELPTSLDVAGAYQGKLGEKHRWTLAADGNIGLQNYNATTAGVGAEYWYQGLVALRTGYRFAPYGNLSGLAGYTAGIGVKLGGAELAYAMTTLGDFGTGNQISLKAGF